MAVNEQLAADLIREGAFDYLGSLTRLGLSDQQTDDYLIRRYGGPSVVDADTAYFVVVQYQLYAQAGQAIERQTNPNTPYVRHLPSIVGCAGKYEYTIVIPLDNPVEELSITKRFVISSDVPLSYNQIQASGAQAALLWAMQSDTGPAGDGLEGRFEQTGFGRVTGAAKCQP
jgi:hypothetical protein